LFLGLLILFHALPLNFLSERQAKLGESGVEESAHHFISDESQCGPSNRAKLHKKSSRFHSVPTSGTPEHMHSLEPNRERING
jgi:hypothetical protein